MFYCDRKRTLSESGLSERVAIRRKGGRTVCGSGWGWVRLGACAGFVVRGLCGRVRTALHLSQGRAGWGVVIFDFAVN